MKIIYDIFIYFRTNKHPDCSIYGLKKRPVIDATKLTITDTNDEHWIIYPLDCIQRINIFKRTVK